MDFGKMEVQYFCAEGWTGVIGLKWLREIAVLAQQIELLSQDTVDPDAPDSNPAQKMERGECCIPALLGSGLQPLGACHLKLCF